MVRSILEERGSKMCEQVFLQSMMSRSALRADKARQLYTQVAAACESKNP